ncbi:MULTISPECIES: D-glycero-beta-D-manno-heptose 1,7-bisphosphate 7-phosphatase [Denitromonas]|uniref:D,D-heptose 1,7-bisphosphate phosphatase n=2 Tax=Denitromonas TaxID=139331 RepID=A0A557R601_9RHOO|nr:MULTISPECIES: D-glycero-beta-D-manno-heptose 1,7-bisphosphate 7-phosphatase [Denitromonas]TVO57504.1 D-glycero-beta-D-manno-heptose 1,7-bisphosphate 7-phosphatase [Denitromonas halophila]TVO60567.1 D-glycero-beta-D-manno-heptose 1,7-bisphosphate 7-phosphatase [Denitromonas ohlonensis]TVO72297.1 D-glycero-beta-D-manno-heptose 1,7-bisphosphate 7-phosphatase [Denitromonas ohlonensis]TVT47789.1 MAG: D-glycero-beta-D-manno-heptose 1,7-bisphosphate 7-phosphatase [Denitromonas halophila]TVT67526.1
MKMIILDRDGVINQDSDQFIKSPEEWIPIPGSLEAIARLNQSGWRVVLASNQSGVGRGLFGMDTLNAINAKMVESLAQVGGRLDAIFFCPHAADSTCDCRKPKPGLFKQIESRFNIDLTGVPMVGDSLRDLQAGRAVGCQTYLVLTGKGERTREDPELPPDTLIFPDLSAIADTLLLD